MPGIVVEPPDLSCYLLLSIAGIKVSQPLGPDPFLPRARGCGEGELRQSTYARRRRDFSAGWQTAANSFDIMIPRLWHQRMHNSDP